MVNLQDILDGYGRQNRSPNNGATIAAFMAGAAAGITAGILLAPSSGVETRAKLKQKAQENMDKTKDKASETADTAKQAASDSIQAAQEDTDTIPTTVRSSRRT